MKKIEQISGSTEDIFSLKYFEPVLDEKVKQFVGSPEKLKDYLFDQYMQQHLLRDFFESMGGYFSQEEIEDARAVLSEFSNEEVLTALSLPYELKEKRLKIFEKESESGKDIGEVMRSFVKTTSKYGFGVGYHCSTADLRPDEKNRWQVKGTEADHRDNDRMMAYYSTQFRHLYKKKHPNFIYMIRTDPSTHKTDGNWSRADSLSVIARVPFDDVENYVQSTAKNIMTSSRDGDEVKEAA